MAPSGTQHPVSQEPRPQCLPADYQHVAYQHVGPQFEARGNTRSFDCPSIQITSIAPNNHVEQTANQENAAVGGAEGGYPEPSWSRDQLYLPLDPCYRDPALCPSPGSSLSSRSWVSDVSSCESYSHVYDDVDGELCDAARLALALPLGSPGCGGGVLVWSCGSRSIRVPPPSVRLSRLISPLVSLPATPLGPVSQRRAGCTGAPLPDLHPDLHPPAERDGIATRSPARTPLPLTTLPPARQAHPPWAAPQRTRG